MNIAVYCSSRQNLDDACVHMARALGHWLGDNGHTLVYGGVDAGLMHVVAKACHDSGGQVVGVVTRNFQPMADRLVDRLIVTADLNERKSRMYLISDLHVVLPGGVGTLDEWLSALSQWVVDKRQGTGIVVTNPGGLFTPTIEQLRRLAGSPFAADRHMAAFTVVDDTPGLLMQLENLTSLQPTNT